MRKPQCIVCMGMLGLVLVLFGIIMTFAFDSLVDSIIQKELIIQKDSDIYKTWKEPPVVPRLRIYFFNMTNIEEFLDGSKPILKEVGPYTYREKWKKVNIGFHNNGTVSYETQKFYFFERHSSVGSEDDLITTLNIPMMTALSKWRFAAKLAKIGLSSLLEVANARPFITKSVYQFTWGYNDILLQIAKDVLPPDQRLPHDQFGFFVEKNGSTGGLLNVYAGWDDMTKYTIINTLDYEKKLEYWKTESCNTIIGTDGSSFPPNIRKDTVLHMFNKDLCRSLPLVYWHDVNDFGIEGMRFTPPQDLFANVSVNSENDCYCVGGPPCIGGGVFNISVCKFGSPTLISWPHFYQADPKYREAVIGMNPDADKHALFFDIAPRTGAPLRAQARFQINIAVPYMPEVHPAAKLREMIFPVMWFEDGITGIPENLLQKLRFGENTPPVAKLSMLLSLYIMGFSIVFIVVLIVLTTHFNLPVPYLNSSAKKEEKTAKVSKEKTPAPHKSELTGHTNTMVSNNPENDD